MPPNNPILIRNCSWILSIHKARIKKTPFEKTCLDFKKWIKKIQTAGYDGARTVCKLKISIEMADSPMNWQILLKYGRFWISHFKITTFGTLSGMYKKLLPFEL